MEKRRRRGRGEKERRRKGERGGKGSRQGRGEEEERGGGDNGMSICLEARIYLSSRFKNAPAYGWANLTLQRMRAISALSVTYKRPEE